MLEFFSKKIFGTRNDRILKNLKPFVQQVNDLEAETQKLSDSDLERKTAEFRQRLSQGEPLDDLASEAFAVVREASVRTLGMRHFDVQLIGGSVLHQGKIAEMKTGEGKTLVATLAAYLNALTEKGVHIVTVNDYLAKRDAEWMGNIYSFLGLSVGVVYSGLSEAEKIRAYGSDITYGQNNEFGFDYLRDNMKYSQGDMMQRGHAYAIVDEVDSILIDEARTPLIISGPAEDATDKYYLIDRVIPKLKEEDHYEIDLKTKQPALTEEGIAEAEKLLQVENLYDPNNIEVLHHVNQALRAHTAFERDVDYVVNDGQVVIVDEFTGRLMPGRRWSNGLHQAIEAKEGLVVARENQTLASITFQNLFRMYDKLAGMTGTADTEASEFHEIYDLEVVVIPTNKPMVRDDQSDRIFRDRSDKYEAVVEDIFEANKTGQPVLVGTISIEQSEALSKHLTRKNVKHHVLNAKHHEQEAEIVAQAGRPGAVTIATNMAGRGTDIVLGGNPAFLAASEAGTRDPNDPEYQQALKTYTKICEEEKKKVLDAGGLFIMGTERHESRRIDNQLRGRSGRQGDPGKSRFYVSLEDDLMKRFGGDRMQTLMERMGWEEGMAMDGRLISKSVESAQRKIEGIHFESRKHVTDYDDVMSRQRQVVYTLRSKVLSSDGLEDEIYNFIEDQLEESVLFVCDERKKPIEWDLEELQKRYEFLFNRKFEFPGDLELTQQNIFDALRDAAKTLFQKRREELRAQLESLQSALANEDVEVLSPESGSNPFDLQSIQRMTILETLDHFWNLHLQEIDHLREGIGLRGYGQKNPLHEYKREGFELFQQMMDNFRANVIRKLFYFSVEDKGVLVKRIQEERLRREQAQKRMQTHHDSVLEGEGEAGAPISDPKSPQSEKEKLEQRKKARRRKKRKK